MILLEPGNRMLQETVQALFEPVEEGKARDPMEVRLCDFDDVSYLVKLDKERTNILQVSMAAPCMHQIGEKGAFDAVKKHYGDLSVEAVGGMDVTLEVNLDDASQKSAKDKAALAKKLSMMKPFILGGVFDHFFDALNNGEVPEPFQFQLRGDCTVYMIPGKDRVVCIYSMHFDDKAEHCIGRVFCQELAAEQRKIGKAPPTQFFLNTPPRELSDNFGIKDANCNLGYMSFAVQKMHVADEKRKSAVAMRLLEFRTHMQYHIKCSKSFFHSRMRARCVALLKVLSRAKIEAGEDGHRGTTKRTAKGKVFSRS